jgi:hypothetical protein
MEARPRSAARATVRAWLNRGVVMAVVPMVVPVTTVAGDAEPGEENCRDDEQDSGHDHNPRSEPV